MKTKQTFLEEFDEKVNELRRLFDIKDGEDSITVSFGYKTCRKNAKSNMNELFSVVDWGNIKDSLSKALDEQKEDIIKEIEKMRLGGHRDEDKRIFAGGYDNAIIDIIKKIKEL